MNQKAKLIRDEDEDTGLDLITTETQAVGFAPRFLWDIALERPRDLKVVRQLALSESRDIGDNFFYQWPVKLKDGTQGRVRGISIEGAYALLRCWRNAIVHSWTDQDMDSYHLYSTFVDLELNIAITRDFKIRKDYTIAGRMDDARKDDMRIGMAQSKSHRNVILKGLPEWLKDVTLKEALNKVRQKLEDDIKSQSKPTIIKKVVTKLGTLGVSEEAILKRFGIAQTSGLETEDLIAIVGDIKALEKGAEFPEVLYPVADTAVEDIKTDLDSLLNEKEVK